MEELQEEKKLKSKPEGDSERLTKRKQVARKFILHKYISPKVFNDLMLALILLNVIILCIDHHKINPESKSIIYMIDYGLTCFFFTDIIFKAFVNGIKSFFVSGREFIDLLIIIFNLIVIIIELIHGTWNSSEVFFLSAVKSFKIMRIFKYFVITRKFEILGILFSETVKVLKATREFLLTVLVFIIMLAFIGRELFAYTVRYDLNKQLDL